MIFRSVRLIISTTVDRKFIFTGVVLSAAHALD